LNIVNLRAPHLDDFVNDKPVRIPCWVYILLGLFIINNQIFLNEATRNAKKAAEEFAKESNTKLGNLKKATQGLFTIIDRDNYLSGQTEYGMSGSDLYKKVRVVVNVDYSIK
jgi:hypothetical protein